MPLLACPHCRRQVNGPESAAGKSLRCPHCKAVFPFPTPTGPVASRLAILKQPRLLMLAVMVEAAAIVLLCSGVAGSWLYFVTRPAPAVPDAPEPKIVYKDKIVYRDKVSYKDKIIYKDRIKTVEVVKEVPAKETPRETGKEKPKESAKDTFDPPQIPTMSLTAYLAKAPVEETYFILNAELDSHYNWEFKDQQHTYYSIRLTELGTFKSLTGYIHKALPDAEKLFRYLDDGERHVIRVKLRLTGPGAVPIENVGLRRIATITKYLGPG